MAGICQGCPLSPFLFIIVTTVIMHDAVATLGTSAAQAYRDSRLFDVLYADDTLLLGLTAADVEALAAAVESIGTTYGMTLHWGKTQALSVCTDSRLRKPNGEIIGEKSSLLYLGAVIYSDGRADSEISRKLGAARADFQQLMKVWRHANLSVKLKLQYFHSLIASKLIYGLASVWLVVAQRRRLNGFYARSLRQILRIPAAYLSRISNAIVFQRSGVVNFSEQLLQRQLIMLGKIARCPTGEPMRRDTFIPGTTQPQLGRFIGRVGRPRQDWTRELMREGAARMGATKFHAMLSDSTQGAQLRWKSEWKKILPSHCGTT